MSQVYDVLVLGGGISGLGIAKELSKSSYSVGVIERGRVGRATSNNSLRIIHGGFRYLQTFNLLRTFESASAQSKILKNYPEFVKVLPCVMPLNSFGLKSPIPARCALVLYKLLGVLADSSIPDGKILDKDFVASEVPILSTLDKAHFLFWNDALIIEPHLITQTIQNSLYDTGTGIHEECVVNKVEMKDGLFCVHYTKKDRHGVFFSKVVVNAMGPWLDTIVAPETPRRPAKNMWVKSYNVVINYQLDPKYAIALPSRSGRLYFAVPRGDKTAIGTGNISHFGDPDSLNIPEQELEDFLSEFSQALSGLKINLNHVDHVEVGILPAGSAQGGRVEPLGRHKIFMNDGYCEVLSTKYTTFETQARKVSRIVTSYLGEVR